MAISFLRNALSSILKLNLNTRSIDKLEAPAVVNNSSLSQDDSCRHGISFFVENSPSASFFELDPETGVTHESLVLYCATDDILATSNGLVFCKLKGAEEGSICVYNLTILSCNLIPSLPGTKLCQELTSHFGLSMMYDGDMSPDYRLVLVFPADVWNGEAYLQVYKSKHDAWIEKRIIDIGKRNIEWDTSVVCGQSIFWVSDCGEYMQGCKPYVLGLNLESESTNIMHLPEEVMVTGTAEQYKIWITKLDEEALCMVQYDESNVALALWEIKLEPIPQWKLLQRISLAETGLANATQIYGFTLISNEVLVFVIRSRIYSYNLREQVLKKIHEIDAHHRVTLVAF